MIIVSAIGCRRHHEPGPGAEPEPAPPSVTATENAPDEAPATSGKPALMPGEHPLPPSDDKPRLPDGGTMNGDARGPRPAVVKRILDGALTDVRACFDANPEVKSGDTRVAVHFFVEPPGYTGAVTLTADAPREVIDCARGVYENLKFPEFRGTKLELAPGFTYWKHGVDAGAPIAPVAK